MYFAFLHSLLHYSIHFLIHLILPTLLHSLLHSLFNLAFFNFFHVSLIIAYIRLFIFTFPHSSYIRIHSYIPLTILHYFIHFAFPCAPRNTLFLSRLHDLGFIAHACARACERARIVYPSNPGTAPAFPIYSHIPLCSPTSLHSFLQPLIYHTTRVSSRSSFDPSHIASFITTFPIQSCIL